MWQRMLTGIFLRSWRVLQRWRMRLRLDHRHFLFTKVFDYGTSRRLFEAAGNISVASRIAPADGGRFNRCCARLARRRHRLGCPARSLRSVLPWVSDEKETDSMPGRLPSMRWQHQPSLWKLWSLRLLR